MSPLSPTAQNFSHACTPPPHPPRFVQRKFSADVISLKRSNFLFIYLFFCGKGFGLVL